MLNSAKKRLTLSCTLLAALSSHSLSGTTEIWQGGTLGNLNNLATATNWSGGAVPSNAGDIAQFDAAGIAYSPQNLNMPILTLSNILFPASGPAYTLTFGTNSHTQITCDNGGIVNQSGHTQTFNLSGALFTLLAGSQQSQNVTFNLAGNSVVTCADNSTAVFNLSGSDPTSFVNISGDIDLIIGSADASTTYGGYIFAADPRATVTKIGTGTVTLTGPNLGNSFSTYINQGVVALDAANTAGSGDIFFTPGSTGSTSSELQILNNFTLPNDIQVAGGFTGIIDSGGFITLDGAIKDLTPGGNIQIQGSITQFNNTGSTYSGTTTVVTGAELQAAGSNVFSPNSAMAIEGTLCNSDGISDFTTSIRSLSGSGEVCPGISSLGTIRIVGHDSTVFTGILQDSGTISLEGGSLELTGDSSVGGSTVGVNIETGARLIHNGSLGGNVGVASGGEITGNGTILSTLVVNGTISPGNSIGTLHIAGNYVQGPNSIYNVEIDGIGNSDLISVSGIPGQAVLGGGEVVVSPLGGIDFNARYKILEATGGVIGTFDGATTNGNALFTPTLDYSLPDSVYLTVAPSIINGARSFNEMMVASQLDMLTSPDAQMSAILSALVLLPPEEVTEVLDQLSGNQHTSDPFIVERMNRSFVRRLYDPIRSIVTVPCRCINPCSLGIDVWLEGSWDKGYLRNDGNGFGFNLNGYEFTLGAQKTFFENWTVGLAGSYAHDFIRYNIGGNGKLDSGFGGLYGLYRPDWGYVLGDIAFGYTSNRINRPISIGSLQFEAKSTAPTYDVIAYAESGFDIHFCTLLIQPFLGIECNTYWRDRTVEQGAGDINLIVYERTHTSATSRLGLHLTSNKYCCMSLSIDAAWNCRLTDVDPDLWQSFVGFGDYFLDRGVHPNRSSAEGAITLTSDIANGWSFYIQAGGEVWNHASNYSGLVGIQNAW